MRPLAHTSTTSQGLLCVNIRKRALYLFDFDKELSPSSIHQQELLLELQRDRVVTSLNEETPRVVHGGVLIHPMAEILEELLRD